MNNFFFSYKSPLGIVAVLILAAGIFTYTQLKVSLFPEITFPKIKVIAENGLQPVNKMMVTVTKPMEAAIKSVPHLQTVQSITSRGSCEISAYLDWNADVDLAQQQLESRINEVKGDLPPGVKLTVERMSPSTLPVMGYVLEGNGKGSIEMDLIANYQVKPFLSQVAGVSSVRNVGGKTKEYWIILDVQHMDALGLTLDMVISTMNASNFLLSNGYVNSYKRMYLTLTDASVQSKSDLENLVVRNNGNSVVLLKDIATVGVKEKVEYTKVNSNGKPALLIAVLKQPAANLIDVSTQVQDKVKELNTLLPKGVSLKPYYIQADFVNDSVRSVTDSLLIGLLLAIVVAVIFLRSFKASLVILITIPITMCLAVVGIYAFGYNLNIMTLGAIAASIGLVIDDAIVVVEQIHRTHEEHPEEETPQLVLKAIKYLFPAMVGSSLSTIVIFVPFILLGGIAGMYFQILTNTMIITLLSSFFVTWILLPVIYLLLSRRSSKPVAAKKEDPIDLHAKRFAWIVFLIRKPWMSFIFIVLLIATGVIVFPRLETGFLPEMDEGSIILDYASLPGTSLEETDSILQKVEKIILAVPEVEAYSRRTGTEMGFFITEPNTGDYLIQLKKKRSRSTTEVIDDIRVKVEATQPSLKIDFGQVISDMLGDLMSSVQPIEVKVFGTNGPKLYALANEVSHVMEKVPGTADIFNGIVIAGPSVTIEPDYAKLAQYGITPSNLQTQLQAQLEGLLAGAILEKEQQTPIRLVYPHPAGNSINNIRQQNVFLPNGKLIPLSEVATVKLQEGDARITRENLEAMVAIKGRMNGRSLGSVMNDIQKAVGKNVTVPEGYHIVYAGAYASQQQSFKELLMILAAASLLVFAVILFLFRSIKVGLLILFVALLGITGSALALFLTHTPLNVGSYTGLIMIVGIIGENAIFTFLQFRESSRENPVDNAIAFSIATRLRPKLMTAIGAIIALLPLALGIGTGAQMHQPLAIAVIGGFLVAIPLLLIVLPTLLRILFRKQSSGGKIIHMDS